MPRPSEHNTAVRLAAFEIWWKEHILDTLKDLDETGIRDSRDNALKLMPHFSHDGYEIAKDFDSEGWPVDADFVERCDCWSTCLYHAHQAAVKAWVKQESNQPKLAKGDKVKIKYHLKMVEGIISAINHDSAQYVVCCAELGHVGEISDAELMKRGSATHGILLDFEVVEEQNKEAPHA